MGIVRKDFLMREIEKAGKMIAYLLGLMERGDGNVAADFIDENLEELLNIDREQLDVMSADLLIEHIEAVEMSQVMIECLAELLIKRGDIYFDLNQANKASFCYIRAILLLEYLGIKEKSYSMKRQEKINSLNRMLEQINMKMD